MAARAHQTFEAAGRHESFPDPETDEAGELGPGVNALVERLRDLHGAAHPEVNRQKADTVVTISPRATHTAATERGSARFGSGAAARRVTSRKPQAVNADQERGATLSLH